VAAACTFSTTTTCRLVKQNPPTLQPALLQTARRVGPPYNRRSFKRAPTLQAAFPPRKAPTICTVTQVGCDAASLVGKEAWVATADWLRRRSHGRALEFLTAQAQAPSTHTCPTHANTAASTYTAPVTSTTDSKSCCTWIPHVVVPIKSLDTTDPRQASATPASSTVPPHTRGSFTLLAVTSAHPVLVCPACNPCGSEPLLTDAICGRVGIPPAAVMSTVQQ
jgi:hypothetical protein